MTRTDLLKISCLILLMACAHLGRSQQPASIHVLLLNGDDGKPLRIGNTGEAGARLSLTIFPSCGPGNICFFPSNKYSWSIDGSGRTEVPVFDKLKALRVTRPTSWLNYCQGTPNSTTGELDKDPEFAVDEILRQGVVSPNRCNDHLRLQPHPGELVFFLRPLTWWERLTKRPQM
jgi:hypothetical protein